MIKIICVGKIKEKYLKDAIEEYKKRITKYSKIEIIEVPDQTDNILTKEKNLILKHLNQKDYIITLAIEGKSITSTEFATKIDNIFITHPNISFSKMTFPHQLFRVLLLEQIYRCFKINNNESYHK